MIPTDVIIAIAVDSAPTSTEVRRSDPIKLREASKPSTPIIFCSPCSRSVQQAVGDGRNRQRGCGDQQDRGEIAEQRFAGDGRRHGANNSAGGEAQRNQHVAALCACAPRIRAARETWLPSGKRAPPRSPARARQSPTFPRQSAARRPAKPSVNSIAPGRLLTYSACTVADNNLSAPVASTRPIAHPSIAPANPKHAASCQKSCENRSAARAQRADNSNFRPPPHHRNRDGVVNQETADQQRDVTQHSQIPAKGGEHPLIFRSAAADWPHHHARG